MKQRRREGPEARQRERSFWACSSSGWGGQLVSCGGPHERIGAKRLSTGTQTVPHPSLSTLSGLK